MKCFSKVFLLLIVLAIVNNVATTEKKKKHHSHYSSLVRKSLNKFKESDCGCKIVYGYFEGPVVKKKKPYKRRWPVLPDNVPKPAEPAKEVTTCEENDGMALLINLRKLFPAPLSQGNQKSRKKEIKNEDGSTTVVVKSKSKYEEVKESASLPNGKFSSQLYHKCEDFTKQIKLDQAFGIGVKAKTGPVTRKLTREELIKIDQMKKKEEIIRRARLDCYSKLRKYLQHDFKIPYKGDKCKIIGRQLFTCLPLIG